jgi:hypothetical protein
MEIITITLSHHAIHHFTDTIQYFADFRGLKVYTFLHSHCHLPINILLFCSSGLGYNFFIIFLDSDGSFIIFMNLDPSSCSTQITDRMEGHITN